MLRVNLNLNIDLNKMIHELKNSIRSVRKNSLINQEIEIINNSFGIDVNQLINFYLEPNCQLTNPADDRQEDDSLFWQKPLIKYINQLLRTGSEEKDGRNQHFILGDAGMGKTSCLIIIQVLNLFKKLSVKNYQTYLLKIDQNCINHVSNIHNQGSSILLLDALDEDSQAYGNISLRLNEILEATSKFHKVFITCRTQFFPKDESLVPREGWITINNFRCKIIFLSYFSMSQARKYLNIKYPQKNYILKITRINSQKSAKGINLVKQSNSVFLRPMLLSYIEDFINSNIDFSNNYLIYEGLIESWLRRELNRKEWSHSKPTIHQLLIACEIVAYEMSLANTRELSEKKLKDISSSYPETKCVSMLELKGKCLLNRNSFGNFRFSHFTFQEFLTVQHIKRNRLTENKINTTDMMYLFIVEALRNNHHGLKNWFTFFENIPPSNYLKSFSEFDIPNNKTNLIASNLSWMNLKKTNLSEAKIMFSYINTTSFQGAILKNCDFRRSKLVNVDFSYSNLEGADFTGCYFEKCTFSNAFNIDKAIFKDSNNHV